MPWTLFQGVVCQYLIIRVDCESTGHHSIHVLLPHDEEHPATCPRKYSMRQKSSHNFHSFYSLKNSRELAAPFTTVVSRGIGI